MICDILIVGGGIAGLQAAISAYEAGCRSIVITDSAGADGGILPQCTHRGFGSTENGYEYTGPEFAGILLAKLPDSGIDILKNTTVLRFMDENTALVSSRNGLSSISFKAVILATGSRERTAFESGIFGTRPSGVFTAGQAQKMLNTENRIFGHRVVIAGCGDLGMIMVAACRDAGMSVEAVVEKSSSYTGLARNYKRCIEGSGTGLLFSSAVERVHGAARVSAVTVRHSDGSTELIACDTLLVATGYIPERSLLDNNPLPGLLFSCGNCRSIHSLSETLLVEADAVGRQAFEAVR